MHFSSTKNRLKNGEYAEAFIEATSCYGCIFVYLCILFHLKLLLNSVVTLIDLQNDYENR